MSLDTSSPAGDTPRRTPAAQRTAGHVAIVGCGPSGCYTALALRRAAPDVHITVFDTRPTPFGLLRYGVAPDHQGMKNVSRQFDRLFASDHVDFVGNTKVGHDVSFDVLEENFDVVVLATGLAVDRPLTVPVDPQARVLGAGQLLRYLNGDPDSILRQSTPPPLGEEVFIVGTGNVAMDVARLLCKADDGFHNSDVDDDAREALRTADLRHLTLLSRGPRDRVRWDGSMFAELCALPGVTVYLDGELEDRSLHSDNSNEPAGRDVRVDVRFQEVPVGIEFDTQYLDRQQTVVRTRFNGESDTPVAEDEMSIHRVDTVVTAMGFIDNTANRDHSDRESIVRVGGCGSGFLGNLAENRALAKEAARDILARMSENPGRLGLDAVRAHLPAAATTFGDWTAVDRAEIGRARTDRVRRKYTSWSEMADVITESRK